MQFGLQLGALHTKSTQDLLLQSPLLPQDASRVQFGLQAQGAQTPDVQFWLRQSAETAHAWPRVHEGLQLGGVHLLNVQFLLKQPLLVWQSAFCGQSSWQSWQVPDEQT